MHSSLQQSLFNWFAENQRDLPWRETYQPYQIWISEIMAQQTQMDRVVEYYNRWMKQFPDIPSLARASEDQILKCWEGLGYYSRASNILKTAKILVTRHNSTVPQERKALLSLPGIGPYTAGAIGSIAYRQDVALVDANIERIFARLFNIDLISGSPEAKREYWQKAEKILPTGKAREFNQALMELGALICRPKQPDCSTCPLADHCLALQYDLVLQRPVPKKSTKTIPIEMATGVLLHKGKIFIQQRLADDVWGSLWEFPGGRMKKDETAEAAVQREFLEETEFRIRIESKITSTVHHYTRYKVTLHCFLVRLEQHDTDPVLHAAQEFHWLPFEQIDQYAFPAGHRKLIQFMKDHNLPQVN